MDERATRFVVGISVGILIAWLMIKIYAAFSGHAIGTGPFHGRDPHSTPEGQLELQQLLKLQQQARAREAEQTQAEAQQQMSRDQAELDKNQAQRRQADTALKQREDAWQRFYVPTPACTENIFGPGCGEAKLKARKAFDAQYPPPPAP